MLAFVVLMTVTASVVPAHEAIAALSDFYAATHGLEWTRQDHHNRLTGCLPVGLSELKSLSTLYLHDNGLEGPLPAELGTLESLAYLMLGYNHFSGSLPDALQDLTTLVVLRLEHNELSGAIPAFTPLTQLAVLRPDDNHFSGQVSPTLCERGAGMQVFDVSRNDQLKPCRP